LCCFIDNSVKTAGANGMTGLTGDHWGIFLVENDTADGASDFIHDGREVTDWRVVDDEVRVFSSLNHFTSKH
jgi:hypothetical protein